MRAPLRLILTRVPEDNAILRELLSDLDPQGVEMVDLPCLKIEHLPVAEPVLEQLRAAYFEAVVFVSKPSVRALLGERESGALELGGRTTGAQNSGVQIPADQIPAGQSSAAQSSAARSSAARSSAARSSAARSSAAQSSAAQSSAAQSSAAQSSAAQSSAAQSSADPNSGVQNPGVPTSAPQNPAFQGPESRNLDESAKVQKPALTPQSSHPDLPNPPLVIGIGIGTREEIEQRGWKVSAIPSEPRAEIAVQELDWLIPGTGPVLHVRGDLGARLIQNALRERGREVVDTVVYRNTAPDTPAPQADSRPTLLLATSPSVFRRAIALIPEPRNIEVLAIGETTARVSRASGLPTHLAPESSPSGLAAGIRRWLRDR